MRLIDADALMNRVSYKKFSGSDKNFTQGFNDAIGRLRSMLYSAPTIEAEPVRHGEWDAEYEYEDFLHAFCSACGEKSKYMYKYCPNCGAKMDGESG